MVCSRGEGYDVTTGEKSVIPARYPKASWHSAGLYAQAEWCVHRTLNFEAGLRYNHYFIRNDFSMVGYDVPFAPLQSSDAGSVSGSAGLNWRPLPDWLFRVNYARGFRAPNVDDMGKLFDSVDGCGTVPNPFLKPEYADNIELGISKRFGPYLRLDLTAYYTHLSNAIVRRDYLFNGSPTMQYQGEECLVQALQNAAEANVWGIQAAVDSRFARYFYVKANVNWQRGFEELDNGQVSPSRHVAPLFGRATLGFKRNAFSIEAYTVFQDECSASDMPEEEKGKTEIYALDADGNAYAPAWITLNMRASYDLNFGLSINATFENITDRRYRSYSSGISASGINFAMGLTYTL
jgi:hemoglobin/transferrin/lactoferrin receptor protein